MFAHKVCETYMEDSCVLEHGIKMACYRALEMLWLLEQRHFPTSQATSPCKKIFAIVQGIGKSRTENMDDKAKHHSFLEMALQGSTLQILGHIAMKTLEDFSAT